MLELEVIGEVKGNQNQNRRRKREADVLQFITQENSIGWGFVDLQTQEFYWDESLEALHGLDPGEFAEVTDGTCTAFLEFLHEDDRQNVDTLFGRHIDFQAEYRVRSPDGAVRYYRLKTFFVKASTNTQAVVVEDITQKKLTQQLDSWPTANSDPDWIPQVGPQFGRPWI